MGISENDVCNPMKDYGEKLRGYCAYLSRQNSRERLPAIAERPPAPLIFCFSDLLLFDRSVPLNIAVDGGGKWVFVIGRQLLDDLIGALRKSKYGCISSSHVYIR